MFDEKVIEIFLEQQEKLLGKKVFNEMEEAQEFLEDCMAIVCENISEVREYLDDAGMDVDGMTDEELLDAEEVFKIPEVGFLVVEG